MFFGYGRYADSDRNSRSPSATRCTAVLSRFNVSTVIPMLPIPIIPAFHRWKSVCTAIITSSKNTPGFRRSTNTSIPRLPLRGKRLTMWPSTSCSTINGTSMGKSPARNATGRFKTFSDCLTKNGAWGCAWNVTMKRMPMSIAGWRVTARKKLFVMVVCYLKKGRSRC